MQIIGISALDRTARFKKEHLPELSPREQRIAQGFDAAAALTVDGRIIAAAAQERFSRQKATCAFPADAIRYCLRRGELRPEDIDFVAHGFSYGPLRKHFQHDPLARARYAEVYSPEAQLEVLEEHFPSHSWEERFVPVPHHVAHAASTYYPSGFESALVVVTDGMGEVDSMTAFAASPDGMEVIRRIPALHSLGVLYGAFTLYLGFFMALDEYKVMGLAPYGDPDRYFDRVMDFVRLKEDGTYSIPLLAENRTQLEKETHRGVLRKLEECFGPRREPESELTQREMDLAAALQAVLHMSQLHLLRHLQAETGLTDLCLAGGVALNCTANGVVRRSRLFDRMFVQPAAGDDGAALGAALFVQAERGGGLRPKRMGLPLWGPSFGDDEIAASLEGRDDCRIQAFEDDGELVAEVARRLEAGQIIGWFDGPMEYGPRALGCRSILADPRAPDMRDRINALVKKREGFRPFAPAVAAEHAARIFEIDAGDESTYAHMLYVTMVRPEFRQQLPAITHVDGSARIQTVDRDVHPRFWALLDAFGARTGLPIVLNTSFNVRGQPIVRTPTEAIDTFLMAGLDALVIGGRIVEAAHDAEALSMSPEAIGNVG